MRLVVIGDSTAFTDDRGPQLPDEPTLYPQVLRRRLAVLLDEPVDLSVLARPGNSVREVFRMLTKDQHAQFEVLAQADAVVVAVGSFDHAPAGVPAAVGELVPYLRPARLRRRVRKTLHQAYPWLVRLRGARHPRTPPAEFERLYDAVLLQVRGLARGAAGVVLGPTSQRAPHYAERDRPWARGAALQSEVAERHGFPVVESWPTVSAHLDSLNVDGIHWPPVVHGVIGEALADALAGQLRGAAPRPHPVLAAG
ncbi:MAG: GDSL-type esterase/lipase family protein [Nitriliruptorales bacterium]|nr:GDSL-type esterase/lipase family protein [Nitriliruptorales bacterium]